MKVVLVLILTLAIALASAGYTPQWASCSSQGDIWLPVNATFDTQPLPNKNDDLQICGLFADEGQVSTVEVKQIYDTVVVSHGRISLAQQNISEGTFYCFNASQFMPPIAQTTFTLNYQLETSNKTVLGCINVQVTLDYDSLSESLFLN